MRLREALYHIHQQNSVTAGGDEEPTNGHISTDPSHLHLVYTLNPTPHIDDSLLIRQSVHLCMASSVQIDTWSIPFSMGIF